MPYFVYLLRCSDNSLYCGIAVDLNKRVAEHNSGSNKSAKYVRSRLPARLMYSEKYGTRSSALKREAEIKKLTKKEKEFLVLTKKGV